MGAPRKPPGERQNRITRDLTLVPGSKRAASECPDAPPGLRDALRDRWGDLWASPLGTIWDPVTDYAALERLFSLYELRYKADESIEEDGVVVEGSSGQPVDHPLIRRMKEYDSEIRHLEDRLGLTPKARLNLGIIGSIRGGRGRSSGATGRPARRVTPDKRDPRVSGE